MHFDAANDDISGRVFEELFPLLSLRGCKSEAAASSNGPRYIAQDRFTGIVHEVRAVRIDCRRGAADEHAVRQRLKLLQDSGKLVKSARLVLPEDAYLSAPPVSGGGSGSSSYFAVSVGPQCGFSLQDIILSGRHVIAYKHFTSLLACVAHYVSIHESLPVHGNITMESVMLAHDSDEEIHLADSLVDWCVGDWSLLPRFHREERTRQRLRTVEDLQISFTAALTAFSSKVRVVGSSGQFISHRLVAGEIADALSGEGLRRYSCLNSGSPHRSSSREQQRSESTATAYYSRFMNEVEGGAHRDIIASSPTGSSRSLERDVGSQQRELMKDVEFYDMIRRRAREEALKSAQDVARALRAASAEASPQTFEVSHEGSDPRTRIYVVPSLVKAKCKGETAGAPAVSLGINSPEPSPLFLAGSAGSGDLSDSLSPAPLRLLSESSRDNVAAPNSRELPVLLHTEIAPIEEITESKVVNLPRSKPQPRQPQPIQNSLQPQSEGGATSRPQAVPQKLSTSRCCAIV